MPSVVIVEDQPRVAEAIALLLEVHGITSHALHEPDAAVDAVERLAPDLVIQDMNFTPGLTDGGEGLTLFRRLRERFADLPILLITAWGSVEAAVQLIKEGAHDYVEKPWDDQRLLATVHDVLRLRRERESRQQLAEPGELRGELDGDLRGLLYRSDVMREVISLALRVARSNVPVLITGANGTGKEKLAEVVQANSSRRDKPFIRVNAGALPESLIEAELFGAEAGAFTGANKRRIGRFEAADGGTLLLDEIGNLSAQGQIKLLRVLQTGEFERVGSSSPTRVDVRILAATNVDLGRAIERGDFRQDLFFRLNVIELHMPPLAERGDDVLLLAENCLAERLAESAATTSESRLRLSTAAREALMAHAWPGNVRELINRVQRALLIAHHEISPADLDLVADPAAAKAAVPKAVVATERTDAPDDSPTDERQHIVDTLVACGGVVSRAAERLGFSRQALYRRMERLGIVLERRPRGG